MNLQQLRFIQETIRHNYNLTEASHALHTSQPGVSKGIIELENELGIRIFDRYGKRIRGLTKNGQQLSGIIDRILQEIENLRRVSRELSQGDEGNLIIGCTHTQARYFLPDLILQFRKKFPKVKLSIVESNPVSLAKQVLNENVDLALATESISTVEGIIPLHCYDWGHTVVAPQDHPLAQKFMNNPMSLTLQDLAEYPLVTYDPAFSGRAKIDAAFEKADLKPKIALEAVDSDVIKTYVELNLGIGIVAAMAYHPERDRNMVSIPVSHLFGINRTWVGIKKDTFIRHYFYEFLLLCAPGEEPRAKLDGLLEHF